MRDVGIVKTEKSFRIAFGKVDHFSLVDTLLSSNFVFNIITVLRVKKYQDICKGKVEPKYADCNTKQNLFRLPDPVGEIGK